MPSNETSTLSSAFDHQAIVTVHALHAGSLTLPESQFVHPADPTRRVTVPSLAFLIEHVSDAGTKTRLIFDLGIRRDLSEYPEALQPHLLTRKPLSTERNVKTSIEGGGLDLNDIDFVIFSHVHWDHVGRPKDFRVSHFVVGPGTLTLLRNAKEIGGVGGSHAHFEADLLPPERTIELTRPHFTSGYQPPIQFEGDLTKRLASPHWQSIVHLPAAIDVFGDQSLYLVDAPGHLDGHINVLARIGLKKWLYLAGDAYHDRRLLTGELEIAQWQNEDGMTCCIHSDKLKSQETLKVIRKLELDYGDEVEVISAHDVEWATKAENASRFWPGKM